MTHETLEAGDLYHYAVVDPERGRMGEQVVRKAPLTDEQVEQHNALLPEGCYLAFIGKNTAWAQSAVRMGTTFLEWMREEERR